MRAYFLVDSGEEWKWIWTYSTERHAGSGKKETADCRKDFLSLTVV